MVESGQRQRVAGASLERLAAALGVSVAELYAPVPARRKRK